MYSFMRSGDCVHAAMSGGISSRWIRLSRTVFSPAKRR